MTIPHRAAVLAEIAPIIRVIRAALIPGLAAARQYFEQHHENTPDPNLAPDIVRWHARRYLDNAGHAVHELQDDYERQLLGNIGLMLIWGRFRLRVRKSSDGELPLPGSDTQIKFYDQLCFEFAQQEPDEVRLMILWDTDKDYAHLTSLMVVLPRVGGTSRSTTGAYWSAPVLEETSSAPGDLEMERKDETSEKSDSEQ